VRYILRIRPPSTGITTPLTYDASSEARKAATAAPSHGVEIHLGMMAHSYRRIVNITKKED